MGPYNKSIVRVLAVTAGTAGEVSPSKHAINSAHAFQTRNYAKHAMCVSPACESRGMRVSRNSPPKVHNQRHQWQAFAEVRTRQGGMVRHGEWRAAEGGAAHARQPEGL